VPGSWIFRRDVPGSWIFRRDPDFRAKAERVLDLHARRFEGKLLHPGGFVISADKQSQLQALGRRHPAVATRAGPTGALREHRHDPGGMRRPSEAQVGHALRILPGRDTARRDRAPAARRRRR
jgi:hypothetical protein